MAVLTLSQSLPSIFLTCLLSKHGALTSTETIRLIRDGEVDGRRGNMEVGEEGYIYIYIALYCHHQNDSCTKMGSDESHFKVSLITCEGQSRKTVHVHKPQPF